PKVTVCHPDALSPLKTACASTAPDVEYRSPTWVPLLPAPLKNRNPVITPLISARNLTPNVTGVSCTHGKSGVTAAPFQNPVGVAGGGETGGVITVAQDRRALFTSSLPPVTVRFARPGTASTFESKMFFRVAVSAPQAPATNAAAPET